MVYRRRFPGMFMPVLIIALLGLLAGCSTGGLSDTPAASTGGGTTDGGTGGTGGTTPPPPAAAISLGTDAVTVKSDNSSPATITATVLDSSNAVIEGADVAFSATGGTISAASVKTDASGQASITFRSGTQDQSNQVVTITATSSAKSAQIPIQVVGSTLTIASNPAVNIPADGSALAVLTITAKNAGGVPVRNVQVNLIAASLNGGLVGLSTTSGTTDVNGIFQVTVTGASAGDVTVTAQGLGTTVTYDYTVTGPAVPVFGITDPAIDPTQKVTGDPLDVTVSAPNSANVTFATTLGLFDPVPPEVAPSAKVTRPVGLTKVVTATLRSAVAGFATVQVYDEAVPTTTDKVGVAFFAPLSAATQVSLQSAASVVALSTGGVTNTTQLRATVRTAEGGPVGNAPVQFSIANPIGGGESISPAVAYTDAINGLATATFTSGSVSTGAGGITINARVLGSGPPEVTATEIKIVIGGTAGSVFIGLGSKITVVNPTTYGLPMSVLVADSSGARVAGAVVSLKLWPLQYSSGTWYNSLAYDPQNPNKVLYKPYVTGTFDNDDVNENLTKDPGEQTDPNGFLRPPNSAAGDLPATVVTDANGVANFDLVYLKTSAAWVTDRVRASALVLGTETTASVSFVLPFERQEAENGEILPRISVFPIDLTVSRFALQTVSYTVPAYKSPYGASTYDKLSPNSVIDPATRLYTFTNPIDVPAGTVYNDYITASDGGTTSATTWVRIVAQ